uniref:Putative disease resistance gene NBS-LRR family protein n=1 Tax=Rhizophora mucronata TaxID=61149 RepID=A0A2P2MJL6_RHIMU
MVMGQTFVFSLWLGQGELARQLWPNMPSMTIGLINILIRKFGSVSQILSTRQVLPRKFLNLF